MSIANNAAKKSRGITFADAREAAITGYIRGGARRAAAEAIVGAAADDVASLVTRELTGEMLKTFVLALDLECGRYVRRHGAAMF
jgi:hypothetical protein